MFSLKKAIKLSALGPLQKGPEVHSVISLFFFFTLVPALFPGVGVVAFNFLLNLRFLGLEATFIVVLIRVHRVFRQALDI